MKFQTLIIALAVTTATLAHADYACVLDNKSLKSSPLLTIKANDKTGKTVALTIYKNKDTYDKVLKVVANDKSEDVLAFFENVEAGIEVSFYMDETDGLGMSEGSVKSKVMNGNIRCLYSEE